MHLELLSFPTADKERATRGFGRREFETAKLRSSCVRPPPPAGTRSQLGAAAPLLVRTVLPASVAARTASVPRSYATRGQRLSRHQQRSLGLHGHRPRHLPGQCGCPRRAAGHDQLLPRDGGGGGLRCQPREGFPVIDTPTLMLWGEGDVALARAVSRGTERWMANLTVRYFPASPTGSSRKPPRRSAVSRTDRTNKRLPRSTLQPR
jgi:hypothetical protein